jgi:type IV secretory pathway protease TraF
MGLLITLFAAVAYYAVFTPKQPVPVPKVAATKVTAAKVAAPPDGVAQSLTEMGYADVPAALADLKQLKAAAAKQETMHAEDLRVEGEAAARAAPDIEEKK